MGHDQVGAGGVEDVDVPVEVGAADDLDVGPQPPAVDRQVDVHLVTVGGDEHRGGVGDAGPARDLVIGGAADDGVLEAFDDPGVLVDDGE